jgi:hypothetical protein
LVHSILSLLYRRIPVYLPRGPSFHQKNP